jgi:xylulokinase
MTNPVCYNNKYKYPIIKERIGMPYIGLDVGTSGCKASIVDKEGNILSYKHCEYSPVSPEPGYIEIDAKTVWAAVKKVLSGVARDDITALSVASFGEAVILLDENDEVLSNSIYYCDIRGSEEVSDILSSIDRNRAEAISGSRANPMFSANNLL